MKKLLATILDAKVRASLAASTVDGALWALMFGFAEYFILPFAIFFGADALQTSLVQGMGQLGVAAAQLLGAALVIRWGRRRRLARLAVSVHALSWVAVFVVAALTRNPWTIVVLYALGLFSTSIAGPGWLSWMNDLVPVEIRGAFWGKRNMVAGLVQFAAIVLAGLALRWAEPRGWTLLAFGVLFSLAALFRAGGVIALGRQHEPPMEKPAGGKAPGFMRFLRDLPKEHFGRFVLFSVLTTFSVNVLGPVLPVYLLKSIGLDYFSYTVVMMVSMVLSFLAMSYWGPLTDRFGNRRILLVTAGALPLLALAWVFARDVPAMLVLQVFAGFVWAGVNLSTTNFIFDSIERSRTASTMASFNALNNICAFSGSLLGGLVATAVAGLRLPYFLAGNLELVFLLSALLRFVVFLSFARGFKEVRQVESSPSIPHLYVYQPFTMLMNRFQLFVDLAFRREGNGSGEGKGGT